MARQQLDDREVRRNLERLRRELAQDPRVLDDALNTLEAAAVGLAPVDTGNLESSWVQESSRTSSGPRAEFGFGAPYAAEVHELPEYARGPRTQAKPGNEFGPAGPGYLIRAMRGVGPRLLEIIRRTLERRLRSELNRG